MKIAGIYSFNRGKKEIESKHGSELQEVKRVISGVLQTAGVTTFAQLAGMKPDAIKKIITDGGVKIGDPATWPQQTKLAADGKWDRLKTLQDKLQGGRKD